MSGSRSSAHRVFTATRHQSVLMRKFGHSPVVRSVTREPDSARVLVLLESFSELSWVLFLNAVGRFLLRPLFDVFKHFLAFILESRSARCFADIRLA